MARLILNLALIRGEYTIALIPAVLRHEYVQSLEMSHKNPAVFVDFITDRIIATRDINKNRDIMPVGCLLAMWGEKTGVSLLTHPLIINMQNASYFLMYSEKSVRCMSPLRASVSCMAKAAVSS